MKKHDCCSNGHDFVESSRKGYYKHFPDKRRGALGIPIYDQSVSYTLLFCRRCGAHKEIATGVTVENGATAQSNH